MAVGAFEEKISRFFCLSSGEHNRPTRFIIIEIGSLCDMRRLKKSATPLK